MKLHSIDCGNMMIDGGALFGVIPKTIWIKKYDCDKNNNCNIKMRSLLIETDDRRILIDTGCGNKQDKRFFKYYYLNGSGELVKSLLEKGFKPEDITDVIHTHLHFDHCGGTLKKDVNGEIVSAFPNADLWVSKKQWDWAINPNDREAPAYPSENILPMFNTGKLKFIENETEILPDIFALFANGHTRGQVIPIINYNGRKIIYCADLIPTMANVPLSFISAFDLFQLDVLDEKGKLLNMAAENEMILFFEHDLNVECCTIEKSKRGVVVKNHFNLNEFVTNQFLRIQ